MRVTKRNGTFEKVDFNKITNRISHLCNELSIDPIIIAQKICSMLYDGVNTSELDNLTAQICASMTADNYEYNILAGRIVVDNHHKSTNPSFIETTKRLWEDAHSILSEEYYNIIMEYQEEFETMIDYSREFELDFFGFKTLEKSYLLKVNNNVIERPSHLWLRVAIGIHLSDIEKVRETYDLLSQKYFTHATPTLFNAGTNRPQMSSCFLLDMEDSVEGIFKTLGDCAQISKWAGGIGINVSKIRGKNSKINGTGGKSDGILPLLRTYNATARHINQSGRRNGSFACYLEPWHPDIQEFLNAKKPHGAEEERARDLFYGLWVCDLFMKRVESDEMWSLICPSECSDLIETYGDEFEELYTRYEREGKFVKQVKARSIWDMIIESQIETGTPYMMYKDAVNKKSNQQNIGTIKHSNLCVAPETLVLTSTGHVQIKYLAGKDVNIWNGKEFSNVSVKQTGVDQKLITVKLSDGSTIDCTPYHKFYIQQGVVRDRELQVGINNNKNVKIVEAKDLTQGDRVIHSEYPIIKDMTGMAISLLVDTFVKYGSPVEDNYKYVLQIDTDIDTLLNLKRQLQVCGVNILVKGDESKMLISNDDLTKLSEYELNLDLLQSDKDIVIDNTTSYDANITIVSVNDNGRVDDTFCFTEEKRHTGIFNGIITGQCTEITEYTDKDHTSVCNLASIALPMFINDDLTFNYDKLVDVTRVVTRNLDKVIDITFYPTKEGKTANTRHRPIGIGIQGLADTFVKMRLPFDSHKARELNRNIFEAIYYGAVSSSCDIAKEKGTYEYFKGSPMSQGKFQFDMWGEKPKLFSEDVWDKLRKDVMQNGIRNSLLVAPMPTASTAQILGNNECFEPFTSNIYVRRTLAGEYTIVNKHLVKDLLEMGMWNQDVKDALIYFQGSVQHIPGIPDDIKALYKTAWELKQKVLIDMAVDRGAFICQSQSLNMFVEGISYNKLTSIHMYGWKKGLKTGTYYIRSKAPISAQNFVLDPRVEERLKSLKKEEKKEEKKENKPLSFKELAKLSPEEKMKQVKCIEENGVEMCMMCSG